VFLLIKEVLYSQIHLQARGGFPGIGLNPEVILLPRGDELGVGPHPESGSDGDDSKQQQQ
jgi:hypothetical protein